MVCVDDSDPGNFQQVAVDCLLHQCDVQLLLKMLGPQLAEVIVRVHVVQGQYQVDERLSAAQSHNQGASQPILLQKPKRDNLNLAGCLGRPARALIIIVPGWREHVHLGSAIDWCDPPHLTSLDLIPS